MKYFKVVFPLILVALLMACSNPKPKNTSNKTDIKDSKKAEDFPISDDRNYVIHNLTNTSTLDSIFQSQNFDGGKLWSDLAHKVPFVKLSFKQKQKLSVPFMVVDMKVAVDGDEAKTENAWFISKQNKIGDFQPIVIRIMNDDYKSLALIILDKNDNYVTSYKIDGGFDAGPYTVGDSITKINPIRYSKIKNDKIITTELTKSYYRDSLKKPSIVDSNVFESIITSSGKIITKQIIKASYRKPFDPNSNID